MLPSELSDLEAAVLAKLAEGSSQPLEMLRAQIASATVTERKMTGVGFYTTLHVPEEVPPVPRVSRGPFGDVSAEIEGLTNGAGFLLWFDNGRISQLEGFAYKGSWPETVKGFTLRYNASERDLRGIDPPAWTRPTTPKP